MADYQCTYRTNYFQVTDEEQYEKLFSKLRGDDMLEFYQALQKILPDQEAMILMEVGNEKLRYVVGLVTIVTNKEIRFVNMNDVALKTVKSMIGEDFTTQMD